MRTTTPFRANPLVAAARAWDRFWFTPGDPTVLGVIRLCCGLLALYIHVAYTFDLNEFFGPRAWVDLTAINHFRHDYPWYAPPAEFDDPVPREPARHGYLAWSVWFGVTDPRVIPYVHGAILLAMFLFAIGFCTRVTSVLTWIGAISYIQRSPLSLFGMDTMMNLLLIYLMIGPSGAAWSVDALLARRAARRGARRMHAGDSRGSEFAGASPGPTRYVSATLALRLIQVNLCIIYLVAGLSKLQGGTWWNGTAIWLTAVNPEFSPLHLAVYSSSLRWLCGHRWLWEMVMSGATAYTLVVEIGFLFLVWNHRTRWLAVGAAMAMHTGIALTMGLTTFSLMMIFMVMSFLPPELFRLRDRRAVPAEESASEPPVSAARRYVSEAAGLGS